MSSRTLPQLITFDGSARSGKGTVVSYVKDYLRDEKGHNVMLIDAGQVFRVLVVAATQAGVDLDDAAAIDTFLADEQQAEAAVKLVKKVCAMTKDERDKLLYSNQVSADSAKIGARALSQAFKDKLLHKWLRDAGEEGFDVVLLDGRALEEVGMALEQEKLCDFALGLYFVCDPVMGARRTLGYAATEYDDLDDTQRRDVDELVDQITVRNQKDAERAVQPIKPPKTALDWHLPSSAPAFTDDKRPFYIVDTSANMTKHHMSQPVAERVAKTLD